MRKILNRETFLPEKYFKAYVACKKALLEIEQSHNAVYPDCKGDCPAHEVMDELRAVVGRERTPELITLQQVPQKVDAPRTRMRTPIRYTGPGWYSLGDDGIYAAGEFATTSRIAIFPD